MPWSNGTVGRRALWLLVIVTAVAGCRDRDAPPSRGAWHRMPPPVRRLLVLAPHPDDEVLAAAALIARTRQAGGAVHVVVATDGEAGVNRTRAPDLRAARRAETWRALGDLGVAPADVEFLGYADTGLAAAWSEQWRTARGDGNDVAGAAVVDALRAVFRAARPDTVVLPMPVDEHPDHRALGCFALLGLLGERPAPETTILTYLIHGGGGWPIRGTREEASALPPGCAGLFPWDSLSLDAEAVAFSQRLVREYRTQLGPSLLRYARSKEPFAAGTVVRADRAASPWRPGVHRGPAGIAITVARSTCLVDPQAGDRIRLRYFRAGELDERIVALRPASMVLGGPPGGALVEERDVRVTVWADAVRLRLDPDSFRNVTGAVIEILGGRGRPSGPAWLLLWDTSLVA